MYNAKQDGKNNDRSTQAGLNVHPFELDGATLSVGWRRTRTM
jgi:hypothetical protein